jgi:hypothetical protein
MNRLLKSQTEDHRGFAMHLLNMFESAMSHVRAKSLEEKMASDNAKSKHDVQLAYLKDTLAKQAVADEQRERGPMYVHDDAGKKYNVNDIEVLT